MMHISEAISLVFVRELLELYSKHGRRHEHFQYINQIKFILLCVCTVLDHG